MRPCPKPRPGGHASEAAGGLATGPGTRGVPARPPIRLPEPVDAKSVVDEWRARAAAAAAADERNGPLMESGYLADRLIQMRHVLTANRHSGKRC